MMLGMTHHWCPWHTCERGRGGAQGEAGERTVCYLSTQRSERGARAEAGCVLNSTLTCEAKSVQKSEIDSVHTAVTTAELDSKKPKIGVFAMSVTTAQNEKCPTFLSELPKSAFSGRLVFSDFAIVKCEEKVSFLEIPDRNPQWYRPLRIKNVCIF